MRATPLLLLACLAGACSRAPEARREAPPPLPVSVRQDPPPAPVVAQPLADAFEGKIGADLSIFARLSHDPSTGKVTGRYFYASKGLDIPLAGSFTPDGTLTLEESSGGKATGRFVGARRPDGGFAGTWSDPGGARSLPFELAPIARRAGAPAVIGKKRFHSRTRVKDVSAEVPPWQVVDLATPELFGLADAKVEARLNRFLDGELHLEGIEDPVSMDYKSDYTVTLNRDGLLSLRFDSYDDCHQCAHPSAGGRMVNLSLAKGEDIPFERLFLPGGKAKLRKIAAAAARVGDKAGSAADPELDAQVIDECIAGDYALHDRELELTAFFRLPHAIQAADPDLHIPYEKLTAILDPSSPAAAAWKRP